MANSISFGAVKNDDNAFCRGPGKTAFSIPAAQQGFTIHIDPEPVLENAQRKGFCSNSRVQELNPALTSLSRAALTNVFVANNRASEEGINFIVLA